MRVVAGDFGGRPLKTLEGKTTRPTTDKVKGAIFNMIGPFFDGGRVLDLFSGSGSLAIEAISRGMSSAVLVEKDRRAQAVIQENIKMTKSEEQFQLLKMDAARALTQLTGQFDLALTSIKGWVETIENIDDPTNENYRRGLSVIGTETDRLYTMVEELLDFSRLQNGIKMNCQVLDFVAEATDAALFVEARIRQEGMQLVYSEPEEPYPVWADPARLRQVFVNLFDNAIKYSEPSGTIFLELSRTPVTVTASIRDQGRGIAADDLEKVKQKFFKAKNSVRGSGIGLAVVDEIVQTLGGRFDIDSTLGQGTTVTVTLPIYHPGQEHLHEKI